jgi:undecaprenyl-diphosphatase
MFVFAIGIALNADINSATILAVLLIVFAVVLYLCDRSPTLKSDVSRRDSLLTGLVQSLSFIPGVSRLGICMSALRYLKYSREESFRYSIMLYIPPVFGACCIQMIKIIAGRTTENMLVGVTGFMSAFIFGLISLSFVVKFLRRHTLLPIVVYRILFGLLILAREMRFFSLF